MAKQYVVAEPQMWTMYFVPEKMVMHHRLLGEKNWHFWHMRVKNLHTSLMTPKKIPVSSSSESDSPISSDDMSGYESPIVETSEPSSRDLLVGDFVIVTF